MKKLAYLAIALILVAGLALVAMPQQQSMAQATTWTVDDDGPADFNTIQEAIDDENVSTGDTIQAAAGNYSENIVWEDKNLSIIGEGPDVSIIDGSGEGTVVYVSGVDNSRLEGFTITNGNSSEGGGMNIQGEIGDFVVENCHFVDNYANRGGGVNYGSGLARSPTFINCTFTNNMAGSSGGGMRLNGHATVIDCVFDGNIAGLEGCGRGGGMKLGCGGSVDLSNCTFKNNQAQAGGALAPWGACAVANIDSCLFKNNSAVQGGGMYTGYETDCGGVTITNSVFTGNQAAYGGGIYGYYLSADIITNCTIVGNQANEDGGGVYIETGAEPTITNCIIEDNSPDQIAIGESGEEPTGVESAPEQTPTPSPTPENGNGFSVTYSNIQDGWEGEGNIDEDSLFVNASGGNFRLTANSPCIDAGTNEAPALPSTDFDGNDRIINGTVDMGAYEFTTEPSVASPPVPVCYSVYSSVEPEGAGTVTVNPEALGYCSSETVTVTASPAPGYAFESWSGDLSGTDPSRSVQMNIHKFVTAHFVEEPNVPVDSDGTTTGNALLTGSCQDCASIVFIPEGTTVLDGEGDPVTLITIEPPDSVPPAPDGVEILGVCRFAPTDATFSSSIIIQMNYSLPPGASSRLIGLAYYDEEAGEWKRLPGPQLNNLSSHSITGMTDSLGLIAVVQPWTRL